MNQLQPLYRGQSLVRQRYVDAFQDYEASLLAELFSRNGREDLVTTATPPGYAYTRVNGAPHTPVDASGPIMQVAAHPGDGPDFFYATYLQMAANPKYHNEYHEILLTDGEGGVDGWDPERTRRVRKKEAYAGAELVGGKLHFLGYPDGSLASLAERERKQLVAELARKIGAIQPAILVVHPPKNDHPDHAYSFLLTVAALELHARTGKRLPTLLMHDVEFGLQQKTICKLSEREDSLYPFNAPDYIVDVSSTHQRAQDALHRHKTQMYDPVQGQPKAYADLIDKLAVVRGLQFMPEGVARMPRGQGLSHVVLPAITRQQNILPWRLPAERLYQQVRKNK